MSKDLMLIRDFELFCKTFQCLFISTASGALVISTASGALVVGGVRDICSMYNIVVVVYTPEIGLSVQWSTTNQSVAVSGSLWFSVVVCGSLW